mmetsp:Transcript_6862/g.12587  ORF Transcript_6862/g.12587 Transcript_6862/m.12587 type:complete len:356 (-) Transcript_6862:3563-4630(-)
MSLRYVVHDAVQPANLETEEMQRMYQIQLAGEGYERDNRAVYQKLKEFLVNTLGYAWIEQFNGTEDGRAAFRAWTDHYNEPGKLDKRIKLAKAELKNLYYRNEKYLPFEVYTGELKRIFVTLGKKDNERLSQTQQVTRMLEGIKSDDGELKGAKAVIRRDFSDNFAGVASFFGGSVADIHGEAQLEYRHDRARKHRFSSIHRDTMHRGGRGRGHFGGRFGQGGRGRGACGRDNNGGRGRGGSTGATSFNGVDVSDPNRLFSDTEWDRLGREGRNYVFNNRQQQPGRGGRGHRGGRSDQGCGRGGRAVEAVESDNGSQGQGNKQASENSGTAGNDRGGRNGCGFGRGAYGGRNGQW